MNPNDLKNEIAFRGRVNQNMGASVKRIMEKYGGIPAAVLDKEFNSFLVDIYIAGAADALKELKYE